MVRAARLADDSRKVIHGLSVWKLINYSPGDRHLKLVPGPLLGDFCCHCVRAVSCHIALYTYYNVVWTGRTKRIWSRYQSCELGKAGSAFFSESRLGLPQWNPFWKSTLRRGHLFVCVFDRFSPAVPDSFHVGITAPPPPPPPSPQESRKRTNGQWTYVDQLIDHAGLWDQELLLDFEGVPSCKKHWEV